MQKRSKNAKLSDVRKKKRTITVWIRDDLAEKVDVIKFRPGGLTAVVEDAIDKVEISDEELAAARLLRRKANPKG